MDVTDRDSEATLSDNDNSALPNALSNSSSTTSLHFDNYGEDQEVSTLFTHHFIPDREPAPFSQWDDDPASPPHRPTPSPPSSITLSPSLPTRNDDVAPKVFIR